MTKFTKIKKIYEWYTFLSVLVMGAFGLAIFIELPACNPGYEIFCLGQIKNASIFSITLESDMKHNESCTYQKYTFVYDDDDKCVYTTECIVGGNSFDEPDKYLPNLANRTYLILLDENKEHLLKQNSGDELDCTLNIFRDKNKWIMLFIFFIIIMTLLGLHLIYWMSLCF